MNNIFDTQIPIVEENFDTLLEHKNIKIVRIVSSDRVEPKEYCQEEDEWVVLLKGSASLQIADKKHLLHKGESLLIPASTPHTILKVEKGTIWLAVHILSQ